MAEVLKGAPVAAAMTEKMLREVSALRAAGIVPRCAVVRVGAREDDLAYERSIQKRFEAVGIELLRTELAEDIAQTALEETILALVEDASIHGILFFRPLPGHLDSERIRQLLPPSKDVDGCSDRSLAGVFMGGKEAFPPCTARAVLEILHHYGIDPAGKRVTVIGRSLVIGRPLAMLLLHENATVTICHTATEDLPAAAREADILVATAGQLRLVDRRFVREGQTVIDVGVNWDPEAQRIGGDVDFDSVAPVVDRITPVPGGVGAVTTCVLAAQVIEAAGNAFAAGSCT